MSWYLEGKIGFPFQVKCLAADATSPLRKGETVEVVRTAAEDACEHDMLVHIPRNLSSRAPSRRRCRLSELRVTV
jgi:hypothetical protein